MYFHLFRTDTIDLMLAKDDRNPSQSSTYFNDGSADRAIDGKFLGMGNCTHTCDDAKAWWRIRFDKLYAVQSVTLFNTETCKYHKTYF